MAELHVAAPPTAGKHGTSRHAADVRFHLRNAELAAERLEHRVRTPRLRDGARKLRDATRRLTQFATEIEREIG